MTAWSKTHRYCSYAGVGLLLPAGEVAQRARSAVAHLQRRLVVLVTNYSRRRTRKSHDCRLCVITLQGDARLEPKRFIAGVCLHLHCTARPSRIDGCLDGHSKCIYYTFSVFMLLALSPSAEVVLLELEFVVTVDFTSFVTLIGLRPANCGFEDSL